jgi:AcrR family transcriptional regulator
MRGSKRRLSILASAAPLFNRRGFAGTSIADVLEATELEKGGLYNHFASKEELAVAAFEYALAQVDAYFTHALAGTASGLARLQAFIDAFERYCERPVVDGGCPLANAALEADDALPFLRERVRHGFERLRETIRHNLLRAVEKSEIPPAIDVEMQTDLIIAALEGGLLLSRAMRSRSHVRRVATALRATIEGFRE